MKLGVVFPQTEIGADPAVVRDYAQTAEEVGYDYLLTFEHVLGANPDRPGGWTGPYSHEDTFHEPFVLFGYLAALTTRIEFVTGVLILPQRQTALVAKQAAALDVLSGGRLRLGIGVGWNAIEYEALNESFGNRGKRQAEQVELLRLLWTQRLVNFAGQYHSIPDAGIHPLPVQRPIPIWFGGGADAVLRRMAKYGDGWMPNSMPIEQLVELLKTLHGYLDAENRDPEAFGLDIRIQMGRKEPDALRNEVATARDLGATHLCINTMGAGLASPQAHIEAIRQFKVITSDI